MDFAIILYILPGALIALTFHEFSHAAVAYWRGDDTAKQMGRLTLNPLKHLDPIGTLMMFIVKFGWAKPVPVNPMNLANPKRDMVLVSLAGPASNMLLAFVIGGITRLLYMTNLLNSHTFTMLFFALYINLALAAFNMIPLAPLDGSKIVYGLLPHDKAYKFEEFMRYGPMILISLIIIGNITNTSILGIFILPWIKLWSLILLGSDITAAAGL